MQEKNKQTEKKRKNKQTEAWEAAFEVDEEKKRGACGEWRVVTWRTLSGGSGGDRGGIHRGDEGSVGAEPGDGE